MIQISRSNRSQLFLHGENDVFVLYVYKIKQHISFCNHIRNQNYEENSKKIGDYLGILDYFDFMRRVVLRIRPGEPSVIASMAQ